MSDERIFLGLGSNLGDRAKYLAAARQSMMDTGKISLCIASSLYETAPVGVIDQPNFLNQVIEVRSGWDPEQLLDQVLDIEHKLGRRRRERWGPRIIDIDLLCYGERVHNSARLTLPHPEAHRRCFVLQPWAEIAPQFFVAPLRSTVAELLAACPDQSPVHRVQRGREDHENVVCSSSAVADFDVDK